MIDATPAALWFDPSPLPGWLRERIEECLTGCWEWQWGRSSGYGVLKRDGHRVYAHRLVYSLLVGPIADGLFIDHLCRNRACCNPAHLEPVTPAENAQRRSLLRPVTPATRGGRPLVAAPVGDERWKPVSGWSEYEVSDLGRVRSLKVNARGLRGRLLRQAADRRGRRMVTLYRDGKRTTRTVHQLVAEAFIGPRPAGMETRHLNDVPGDNRFANLTYGTSRENKRDMVFNGHHHCASRTHCPRGHPYDDENTYWHRGKRQCRTCRLRRVRKAEISA